MTYEYTPMQICGTSQKVYYFQAHCPIQELLVKRYPEGGFTLTDSVSNTQVENAIQMLFEYEYMHAPRERGHLTPQQRNDEDVACFQRARQLILYPLVKTHQKGMAINQLVTAALIRPIVELNLQHAT